MPSALVTTPAAVDANAYCTALEADAYHDDLPVASVRTAWTSASSDDKSRAILEATRLIDRAFEFQGARTTVLQALAWPRYVSTPIPNDLGFYVSGVTDFYVDPRTIPDRVKQATAEYARQLLTTDRTADYAPEARGIKRMKADVIEIEFKDNLVGKPVPDAVCLLLSTLGYLRNVSTHTVKLQRA